MQSTPSPDQNHEVSEPDSPRRLYLAMIAVSVAAGGLGAAVVKPLVDGDAPRTVSGQVPVDEVSPTDVGLLASIVDRARSLDCSGNDLNEPTLGQTGGNYTRVAEARYADGIGDLVDGPPERYLSNRIFNDSNQNIFSDNGVTHWSFVWRQFIDHTIGLRAVGEEPLDIAFDPDDPLEEFRNDLGGINTMRSAVAEGTGTESPREQVNTLSSYIDGWAVYGGTEERLDWLREGLVDGDPTNNDATLLNDDGYLPTGASRAGVETPETDLMGRLFANPDAAVIAGDVRVNENTGLTAVHTLFLREHNRIVDELPDDLDEETKFQLARRVVGALQQYITYTEYLPAMGIELAPYAGYDQSVDPSISNEFATVGFRAHSAIHGEFELEVPLSSLDPGALDRFSAQGVSVAVNDTAGTAELAIPLAVAFGNPSLVEEFGLGNVLAGLSSEAAYANDEQIDNQLRSVLFQLPGPDVENPLDCLDGEAISQCFTGVNDLGALDVLRAYDHGMPTYNDLRVAYGLEPVSSFAELTGESTESLGGLSIDDPAILDFVALQDGDGNVLVIGSDEAEAETVVGERRTTTAARLAAVFADVDEVDAFTGMVSEPHVHGTEFGELQLAMWARQFSALRDGDRFFYGNDRVLAEIAATYGIDFRRSLAEVIADNTDIDLSDLPDNVFLLADDQTVGSAPTPSAEVTAQTPPSADQDGDRRRLRRPDRF